MTITDFFNAVATGKRALRLLHDEELAALLSVSSTDLSDNAFLYHAIIEEIEDLIVERFRKKHRRMQHDDWSEEPDYDWLYSADSDHDEDFDKYDTTRR